MPDSDSSGVVKSSVFIKHVPNSFQLCEIAASDSDYAH